MDRSGVPHPGVRYPPPLLFLAGLAAGWLLHRVYPAVLASGAARGATLVLAWVAILLWALLTMWAVVSFRRARTAIIPNRPATMLVLGGPYRFTRNPMYLGFVLFYIGATLFLNSVWPLLLLPLLLAVLYTTVIRREENYLAAAFGPAYEAYRTRVRRWL